MYNCCYKDEINKNIFESMQDLNLIFLSRIEMFNDIEGYNFIALFNCLN